MFKKNIIGPPKERIIKIDGNCCRHSCDGLDLYRDPSLYKCSIFRTNKGKPTTLYNSGNIRDILHRCEKCIKYEDILTKLDY